MLQFPYYLLYTSQVIKQADLVLALWLCGDQFDAEQKARDFDYYERITVRDSSLSACIQGIVAAEVGHLDLAYDYFAETSFIDLRDLALNTHDGVHLASLSGSWLVAVAGFGGMRDHGEPLSFAPRLPSRLTRLAFRLTYRGRRLRVEVNAHGARYELLQGEPLELLHHGEPFTLTSRASRRSSRSRRCPTARRRPSRRRASRPAVTRTRDGTFTALSAGGDRRLAERDAAVVGRQALRDEHAQAGARSRRSDVRSSRRRFWNDAAGEDDGVEAAVGGEVGAGAGGRVGERVVEARRDHAGRHAAGDVAVDGEDRLAGVEHAGHRVEPVGARLGAVAGGLELHRRLALVGDLEPQPAQRGDGVEQPPDRRRDRRRRAGRGHPRDRRASAPGRPPRSGRASPPAAARQAHAIRHGSRSGGVAAGERDRATGARRARSRAGRRRGSRRPTPCRRCRRPVPSKIAPTAGPVSPCSARHAARCAWWCCTPTCSTPSRASA